MFKNNQNKLSNETLTYSQDVLELIWLFLAVSIYIAIDILFLRYGLDGINYKILLFLPLVISGLLLGPIIYRNKVITKPASQLYFIAVMWTFMVPFFPFHSVFLTVCILISIIGLVQIIRYTEFTSGLIRNIALHAPLIAAFFVSNQFSVFSGGNTFGPEYASLGWYSSSAYFHAGIGEIFQQNSVISVGIDGLDPLFYHTFSHIWFSQISSMVNSNLFESYAFAFQIIILPMLLFGLIVIAKNLRTDKVIPNFGVFLCLLAVMVYFSHPTLFESESYTVSLILFIAAICYLSQYSTSIKQKNESTRGLYKNVITGFLLLIIYLAKVSTGIIFFTILMLETFRQYRFSRQGLFLVGFYILISIVGIVATNLGVSFISAVLHNDIFNFYKINTLHPSDVSSQRIPIYNFVKYSPLHALQVFAYSIGAVLMLRRAIKIVPLDAGITRIMITAIAASIGFALTDIARGDSWYFSQIGELLSLVILSALIMHFLMSFRRFPEENIKNGIASVFISIVICIFGLILFYSMTNQTDSLAALVRLTPGSTDTKQRVKYLYSDWLRDKKQSEELKSVILNSFQSKLIKEINNFINGSPGGKAVYISPPVFEVVNTVFEAKPYPRALASYFPRQCGELFFVQALVGLPTINSVYKGMDGKCHSIVFGKKNYDNYQLTPLSNSEVCEFAIKRGIQSVFILHPKNDGSLGEVLDCRVGATLSNPVN